MKRSMSDSSKIFSDQYCTAHLSHNVMFMYIESMYMTPVCLRDWNKVLILLVLIFVWLALDVCQGLVLYESDIFLDFLVN